MTFIKTLLLAFTLLLSTNAVADTLVWNGPTNTLTVGLSEADISHVEFPEEVINVTIENPDYVDVLLVEGYANRAFRMRSLLPQMATRAFFTGQSGQTYIVVLTTDVPYRAFLQIVDGTQVEEIARRTAEQFDMTDMIRAMALESSIPGVLRETYIIPNWFGGAGLQFDLVEVWQNSRFTGLVVNVHNQLGAPNEVNLAAISIPQTDEWGVLRQSAMENMRLEPAGKPGDKGVMYLLFAR